MPSLGERLAPWERLGFAQMHQDAIRETVGVPAPPDGLTIRRGGADDLETAIRIGRKIHDTQARSPSFSDVSPGDDRDDWIETLEADDVAYFVAERDGDPVGHATLYPADPDFGTPADAIFLASTATLPATRGSGAGVALTEHALAWACGAGHPTVWTNWRTTNLLASRFWPARGFRPTYVRLHRAPGIA